MFPRIHKCGKAHSVRIVVVDDHVLIRDLMIRALMEKKRHVVVAAVGTAAEAVRVCRRLKPDVLILDINLPDRNGIDALPDVKRAAPSTRILLCTGFPTDDRLSDLAATGAHGFVEKTNSWDEFLHAIERVSDGEYYFCSHNSGITLKQRPTERNTPSDAALHLTPREKEVIGLIAQGLMSKEIAIKLSISIATVETHRTNLMTKLGVRNVAELMSYAFRTGLARPSKGA
jgi:DNA-binding NarL/FixJ family response regulator